MWILGLKGLKAKANNKPKGAMLKKGTQNHLAISASKTGKTTQAISQ